MRGCIGLQATGQGMEAFWQARSIAIVGASDDPTKIGGRPVHLLRRYGYAGTIYPVNPKGGLIQGVPAWTSVLDLPQAPDMAVLAVPPAATVVALRDCAVRGVRAVVVLSSGFAEAGPEGAALQQELVAIAKEAGMRLLGPNCLGTVSVSDAVIGSFTIVLEEHMPIAGAVGIVSQSGNIGSYLMQEVAQRGLGISRFVATGNEADVDIADGIAALARDVQTQVILCVMETCRDAGRLMHALDLARAAGKAVLVLKIGATASGQAAAASHTGALAGSDAVIDAVLRRHGALRVHALEELLDMGQAASMLLPDRLPRGDRVAAIAASGGFGIMMADAATRAGLSLPPLSAATQARLTSAVPIAGTGNPVDASAQMSSRPDILYAVLSALMEEPGVDITQLFLSLSLYNARLRGIYMQALARIRDSYPDRLLVVTTRGPADAVTEIVAMGIPVFPSIDAAAAGLAGLHRLAQLAELAPVPHYNGGRVPLGAEAFGNEHAAKAALAIAGVPVLPEALVATADEAVEKAIELGFPVVLKIVSATIPHKTEVGGVALGLADAGAVRAAYARILSSVAERAPNAVIDGILVAPMAGGGVGELIMGISHDPVFGPVVMVGSGGIHAEILHDVQVQVAPVTLSEAETMIRALKLFPVLDGARGQPRGDIVAAARALVCLADFACRHAENVAEIDLNPVLVRPEGQGGVALDALIVPRHTL